jgi:hypothetical protein
MKFATTPKDRNYNTPNIEFGNLSTIIEVTINEDYFKHLDDNKLVLRTTGNGIYFFDGGVETVVADPGPGIQIGSIPIIHAPTSTKLYKIYMSNPPNSTMPFSLTTNGVLQVENTGSPENVFSLSGISYFNKKFF